MELQDLSFGPVKLRELEQVGALGMNELVGPGGQNFLVVFGLCDDRDIFFATALTASISIPFGFLRREF